MAFDYKAWYQNNKTRLSEDRKQRYKKDPEYRSKAQKRSRTYWRENKAVETPADRTVVTAGSREYYSISKIASLIGRKPTTIRDYHNNGVLPQPTYSDTRGWRLYTKDQAHLLYQVFKDFDAGKLASLAEVAEVLREGWDA